MRDSHKDSPRDRQRQTDREKTHAQAIVGIGMGAFTLEGAETAVAARMPNPFATKKHPTHAATGTYPRIRITLASGEMALAPLQ